MRVPDSGLGMAPLIRRGGDTRRYLPEVYKRIMREKQRLALQPSGSLVSPECKKLNCIINDF